MIDAILDRLRPEIQSLKAYSSAHMEAGSAGIRLNANELPVSSRVDCGDHLNRYPEPQPSELLSTVASLYGLESEQILAGRGSDECIDLLVRAFCRQGHDAIAITPPVFGMYKVAANIQGAEVLEFPLLEENAFLPDLENMAKHLPGNCKIVFLCSPHNPIGNSIPEAALDAFCSKLADKTLVVVDEAYIEFSNRARATELMPKHDNLAVLRTLSKAWGLAGIRLGFLLAHPALISALRPVMAPYPVPTPVSTVALDVLAKQDQQQQWITDILNEKTRMQNWLEQSSLVEKVFPSDSNFLLVRFHDAASVFNATRERAVHLRDQSRQPGLSSCLRMTIGSAEENRQLIDILESL